MGRYVIFGFASGGTDPKSAFPNLPLNLVLMRAQKVLGSITPQELLARGERLPKSVQPTNHWPQLLQMVADGKLNPYVRKSYALDEFIEAFNDLAMRKAIGKVIVSPRTGTTLRSRL